VSENEVNLERNGPN